MKDNVTIKDIAKASGVSTASVSRVLNQSGNTSEELKVKVLEAVRRLNYQPNAIARSLKLQQTNIIGVIIPDISNSYFMRISKGLEANIGKNKYNIIFASSNENPEKEKNLLKTFVEKRVDAIVIATAGGNDEFLLEINEYGIPIVLIDRELNNRSNDLSFVGEDNIQSAFDLTNSLLNKGHQRIGIINGNLEVSTGYDRFQGYLKAINERNINQDEQLIYNGDFTEESGINAVNRFMHLNFPPTAIISFNNKMTYGAIVELVNKGLTIPKDIVLASYGESEMVKIFKEWEITYVKQTPYEMGEKVGEILQDKLINKDKNYKEFIFKQEIYSTANFTTKEK